MAAEKLYDMWAGRNPQWEKRYEDDIIKKFCDYGAGATSYNDVRGKTFGGGYEIFIVAFFIGLYMNERRPLIDDSSKRKSFGWPIQNWGNLAAKERTPYPKLREFMFAALIARTDIDFIALEKGEMKSSKAVDMLIQTMEEYANYGFHFMQDKLAYDPNYFYREDAFLEIFLSFNATADTSTPDDDDEPESLD